VLFSNLASLPCLFALAAIQTRCEQADPRHGALWTKVSKATGNSRLHAKQILTKVAELVSVPL
jgi:hypothetical protein